MRLEKLRLFNIKKHKDKIFDFQKSSTMILGKNGSGKSTIVESIYYLLFRSLLVPNINEMINSNIIEKKNDTIKYKDKAFIEGWFECKGKEYHLITGLAKCNCSLEELVDNVWVEKSNKITEIYDFIQTELLDSMTPDYFINAIYTEQMGILNLVSKTESIRQKEFDKLINIERFQIIHECLNKPTTDLNKLFRHDIKNLEDEKVLKVAKKDELSKTIRSYKTHEQVLESKIKEDEKIFLSSLEAKNILEEKQSKLNNAYSKIENLNNIYIAKNNMLDDAVLKNKLFLDNTDHEKNLKEYSNLVKHLNETYTSITTQCSELNNYNTACLISFEKDLEVINNDIKQLNMLNIYTTNLIELNETIDKYTTKIPELEKEIERFQAEVKENTDELNECRALIRNYQSDITQKIILSKSLLSSYENYILDKNTIEKFFKNNIETLSFDMTQDVLCPTCKTMIPVEKIMSKLNSDKLEYMKLEKEIDELDQKLLVSKEHETLFQECLMNALNKKNESEFILNNTKNIRQECIEKSSSYNTEMTKLTAYIKHKNTTIDELLKRSSDIKNIISSITHDQKLKTISMYYLPSITTSKQHDIDKIILDISEYTKEYNTSLTLNEKIREYNNTKMFYEKSLKELKETIDKLRTEIENNLAANDVTSIESIKNNLHIINNKTNELTVSIATLNNDLNHNKIALNETKNLISRFDKENNEITHDIEKINCIIEKNIIIKNKLDIINTSKSYFKQDGLAKYIRKYYIDKINESIKHYIHLFNFDFCPELDETAGIVDYYKYSGGQKIAIAILIKIILNFILKNPIQLLILDEPTPYLDTERIGAIKDLVDKIKNQLQVIVITHDTEFMNINCNKIIFEEETI